MTKKMVNITMYGDGSQKTIVTGNKNFADGVQTFRTATFGIVMIPLTLSLTTTFCHIMWFSIQSESIIVDQIASWKLGIDEYLMLPSLGIRLNSSFLLAARMT